MTVVSPTISECICFDNTLMVADSFKQELATEWLITSLELFPDAHFHTISVSAGLKRNSKQLLGSDSFWRKRVCWKSTLS